jgi:hypothetical protein
MEHQCSTKQVPKQRAGQRLLVTKGKQATRSSLQASDPLRVFQDHPTHPTRVSIVSIHSKYNMNCFIFSNACLTMTGRGALCTTQGPVNPANGVYGKQREAI